MRLDEIAFMLRGARVALEDEVEGEPSQDDWDLVLEEAASVRAGLLEKMGKACPGCMGFGEKTYPDTGTWVTAREGGFAGAALTHDVCDACWGTGRSDETGIDLWILLQTKRTAMDPQMDPREQVLALQDLLKRLGRIKNRRNPR